MNAEQIVRRALAHLANGHVYADVAEEGVRPPWIVYQAAGGNIFSNLRGNAFDMVRTRMQITVWHATPEGRSSLMQQVVRLLIRPEVGAVPLSGPSNVFEDETQLYGSRLDVSIWSAL